MNILAQKSLLAKLMATENLTIRQASVSTASFDVLNRVLTVPILDHSISKELYDLFMGHEVGHALYTPVKEMAQAHKDGINMSVLNVVEDSRIERKIKNKYPGIRAPFIKAYGELFENDFFGTEGKNVDEYNLIDRINLHCKIGASLALPFTAEERELLREVETTETYEDVIAVTKKLCDLMQDQLEAMEQSKIEIFVESEDPDGEETDDEGASSESDDTQDEPEEKNEATSKESETKKEESIKGDKPVARESKNNTEKQEEETKSSSSVAGPGASKSSDNKEIRSYTDDAYRKNEDRLFSKEKVKYVYADVPVYDPNKIMDYKVVYKKYEDHGSTIPLKEFAKYKQESNKVVSYLVKEFELRKNAEQMKRASTAKTGELDMNRIYSYNFSEDIFKKMAVVPNGKSHGLVMFLDWSGSMYKHLANTVKQLINLALFCKKVNIPFEVYSFLDDTDTKYMFEQQHKDGDLRMGRFALLNILSSRMNASDFSKAGAALLHMSGAFDYRGRMQMPSFMPLNGTPLNEAIISAMEIVPQFQKRNKLQIVNTVFLTDGEGNMLTSVVGEYKPSFTHMHIRDPKTGHEEVWDKSGTSFGVSCMSQTDALIRLLKARTNAHVIGFYVCESRDVVNKMGMFFPHVYKEMDLDKRLMESEKIKNEFRNKCFSVVTSTGFDDYYLLRSSGLDTDDDEELSFKENATTRSMATAFSKHAGKKITSRVVLNRFIDLIS